MAGKPRRAQHLVRHHDARRPRADQTEATSWIPEDHHRIQGLLGPLALNQCVERRTVGCSEHVREDDERADGGAAQSPPREAGRAQGLHPVPRHGPLPLLPSSALRSDVILTWPTCSVVGAVCDREEVDRQDSGVRGPEEARVQALAGEHRSGPARQVRSCFLLHAALVQCRPALMWHDGVSVVTGPSWLRWPRTCAT